MYATNNDQVLHQVHNFIYHIFTQTQDLTMKLHSILIGRLSEQAQFLWSLICLILLTHCHMTDTAYSSDTVYLIKPTDATPCSEDPTLKYKLCLILEEYIEKESVHLSSETTLVLLPGTHTINSSLNIKNVNKYTVRGYVHYSKNATHINCNGPAGISFENVSHLQIKSVSLNFCGNHRSDSSTYYAITVMHVKTSNLSGVTVEHSQQSAIWISNSNATVTNLTLSSNNGTGLNIDHCIIDFTGTTTLKMNLDSSIVVYESKMFIHGELTCYQNKARYGGAIHVYNSTVVSYSDAMLNFSRNSATQHGGAMYISLGKVTISSSVILVNNYAGVAGGGIMQKRTYVSNYRHDTNYFSKTQLARTAIIGNQQLCSRIVNGSLNLNGTFLFQNNTAMFGGGLYTSTMQSVQLSGNITFVDNSAERGGGIYAQCITNYALDGIFLFRKNSAKMGGAVNMYNVVTKHLRGDYQFIYNTGSSGGGIIYFYSGVIFDSGKILFQGNSAHTQGGGIFLYQTHLQVYSNKFNLCNNSAQVSGGALYMQASNITFNYAAMLHNNSALFGGGAYLTAQSYLFFNTEAKVFFSKNKAMNHGGALLIHDEDYSVTCMVNKLDHFDNACFYQPLHINVKQTYQYFSNNTARLSGNMLYGGTIDFCHDLTISRHLDFRRMSSFNKSSNGISDVSSEAYKLCLCSMTEIDCSKKTKSLQIYPGESFRLGVMTIGQWNGSVPSTVLAFPDTLTDATLGHLQVTQQTNSSCTDLTYTVFTTNRNVKIPLKVGGRCSATGTTLVLNITLKSCPKGFQISQNSHMCMCTERLRPYAIDCTVADRNIHRTNNYFWVNYDTQLGGLIIHPHCPFDYCTPPPVNFTLYQPDKQCNYNRTGRLCGQCSHGLSLVLGTSKCKQCSNRFIFLLAVFALAGLLLLTSVLVLRATVAIGTFSGIIFYCNIVHINRTLFFPDESRDRLNLFVSWMNVDLGIETCFYNGMDIYAKAWLQFVFPVYIWMLCGILILATSRSTRLSQVLGTNPVAVLATLFLVSYTKIVRSGIMAVAATRLLLPEDRSQTVWQYDASVRYLRGKHIPLFIVGSSLLFLSLPYTIFLLTNEVLRAGSNTRLLVWMNSPRITYFTDAYNAPFKKGHAYWTGLLLITRMILMFTMAGNVFGDPNVNLLTTSFTTITLATLEWVVGGPYKSQLLNILEALSILNLSIFSAGTFYINYKKDLSTSVHSHAQTVLATMSVGMCMSLFTAVLIYHTCLQVKGSFLWKILISMCTQHRDSSLDTTTMNYTSRTTPYDDGELREPLLENYS